MNKDMLSRHELSSALAKVGRYKTDFLPTNDKRPISISPPLGLGGVVIHRRFFRNHNSSKMCLECIFHQLECPGHCNDVFVSQFTSHPNIKSQSIHTF
jgi:hypothetical protein